MGKRKTLSQEKYRELGKNLFDARNLLLKSLVTIANGMPLNSDEYKLVKNAYDKTDLLRSELDNRFFKEHPSDYDSGCFYRALNKEVN